MLMSCFYLRSDFGSDKLGLLTNSNWPVDCHELDETTREGSRLANSSSVPHALPPSTTQVRIVRVSLDLTRNFVISREQKNCDISYLKGKNITTIIIIPCMTITKLSFDFQAPGCRIKSIFSAVFVVHSSIALFFINVW